jgi:hypothetical protein
MNPGGSALVFARSLVGKVAALRRHPGVERFPELEVGLSEVQMQYAELVALLAEDAVDEDAEMGRSGDGERVRVLDGKSLAAGEREEG